MVYGLVRGVFGSALLRTFSAIGMLNAFPSLFLASALCTAGYILLLLVEMIEKRILLQPVYDVRVSVPLPNAFIHTDFLGILGLGARSNLWRCQSLALRVAFPCPLERPEIQAHFPRPHKHPQ